MGELQRYAACVEYNGKHFNGWQRQKHASRTVQEELERALTRVADHTVEVITAGRTDAGVHASHQVIHFESGSNRTCFSWCRGANRFLKADIRVLWVAPVKEEFHARFSALSRSYRYIIYNQSIDSALFADFATHEYRTLDAERMADAAQILVGEHDFSSFRAAGCQAHSPVRTVSGLTLSHTGPWIWFDIQANAFLQHMVRNIAGALIEIGCGKRSKAWLVQVLEAQDRTKSAITAAPNGLYLTGVGYDASFALPSSSKPVALWG